MNIYIWLLVYICVAHRNYLINCHPYNDLNRNDKIQPNTNNEARILYDQLEGFIMDSEWLPIEINVPDTISSAMNGISNMWTTMMDYYQNWNESQTTPRKRKKNATKTKRINSKNDLTKIV